MNAELKKIVRSVQENTGIEIHVYSGEGEPLSHPGEPPVPWAFDGISQSEVPGRTLFGVVYRAERFICAIEGAGREQRNYAFLLSDLIENCSGRVLNLPKAEFARRILLGECGQNDIQKYRAKYGVPDLPCFALVLSSDGKMADVIALLSQYADNDADCAVSVSGKECAFIKFAANDSDYQSSTDFADFLARSLYEELGIRCRIGVGGSFRRFEEIGTSYGQAREALRMSAMFNAKGSVHSYREFLLVRMLEDLPEGKLSEYLSILLEGEAKELLKDEDILGTAEEFLENSLNVSETSRNLYMHRNTLMYRLDKIERVTGLNLRKFSDAVSFRIITILSKLV